MSEQYLTQDGYKPLTLPLTGEELLEGRQYALTPLARLILREEFGLNNVPTIVECDRRQICRSVVRTLTERFGVDGEGKETYSAKWSVMELDAQQASFHAYMVGGRHIKFTLDIARMEALAPIYDKSHKLPALEAEWFAEAKLPPTNRKFRGCSLRWWEKTGADLPAGGTLRSYSSNGFGKRRSPVKAVDLSVLD